MPTDAMKLTVIVPAYNVAAYIGDTLDSIAIQTPAFDEIIIVNDGSTDNTLDVIQAHPCGADARVFNTKNNGLGPARNLGIERANGDYIYFLDADDVLDPDFTSTVHACISAHDAPDLVLFSGSQFLDDGRPTDARPDFARASETHTVDGETAVALLSDTNCLFPVAVLYISKLSLWHEQPLRFKPIVHEDEEVVYPLLLSARSVSVLTDVLYHRRMRPNSLTSSIKTSAHSDGLLTVTRSMTKLYQENTTLRPKTRRIIRKRVIRHAKRYMRTCHKAATPVDYRIMFTLVRILKSPNLVLAIMGVRLKNLLRRKQKQ